MNLSRIQRLLQLLALLQAGKGYNAESLAEACGVSRRTIFRDLDILRESGLPLIYDEPNQRYRLPGTQFLPPTNFTPEEAISLIVLCHEMGRSRMPFLAPARNAAMKLESSLPTRLREQLRSAVDSVQIEMPPTNPLEGQQPIYEQLLEAASRAQERAHSLRGAHGRGRIPHPAESLPAAVQPPELVRDRPLVAAPQRADVQRRADRRPRAAGRRVRGAPRLLRRTLPPQRLAPDSRAGARPGGRRPLRPARGAERRRGRRGTRPSGSSSGRTARSIFTSPSRA